MYGNLKARGARALGLAPQSKYEGLTDDQQTVANAWDSLKRLYVRQFTGAGMPVQEAMQEAEINGPNPGDSEALVQQKFQRQERMVEQMRAQSPGGTAAMSRAGVTPADQSGRRTAPATRVASDRIRMAQAALNDPEATPRERARAAEILKAAGRR
jgi:hypothetical protein